MKILDTSQATATVTQPVKAETLNFLQTASSDIVNFVLSSLTGIGIPGTNEVIIISGCDATLNGSTWAVTAGYIWFNAELFAVPAATFSAPSGGNIMIATLAVTPDTNNADPLTFSDQIQRNVHNNRTLTITTGTTATQNYQFPYSPVNAIISGVAVVYVNVDVNQLSAALTTEIQRATAAENMLTGKVTTLQNFQALEQGVWKSDTNTVNWTPFVSGGTPAITSANIRYLISGKKTIVIFAVIVDCTASASAINLLTYSQTWLGIPTISVPTPGFVTFGTTTDNFVMTITQAGQLVISPVTNGSNLPGPTAIATFSGTIVYEQQ